MVQKIRATLRNERPHFGLSGPRPPEKVDKMQVRLCRRPSLLIGLLFVFSCREPRQLSPTDGGLDVSASGGRGTADSGTDKTGTGGGALGGGVAGTGGAGLGGSVAGSGGDVSPGNGGAAGTDGGAPADAMMSPDGAVTCSADQKLCSGACVAVSDPKYGCGSTSCDSSACPNVAGATLVCQSGACVVGTCGTGTKTCGGLCVGLTDPSYGCGAATCDASTCPNPGTGGTVICQGGACVIGTCPPDFKKCGTKCVAVSDPTYGCGASTCDATSCPAAGTGTLVCQAGACVVGACGAGTKKCGDKCVTTDVNNGCADAARCTTCASNETCMGTPTACSCAPNCTGKCGGANGCGGTCPNNCATPQTCGGGGTANVCGCTPMCTGKCGGSDGCGGTCPNKCVSPQTCGGSGTTNVCGCTAACSGKCGGSNGCGGTCPNNCTSPQTCGGGGTANVCGCAAACSGKCGGSNGCGGTCPNNCTSPQTCGGGGTTNACGCTPNSSKCGTRTCGMVSDSCTSHGFLWCLPTRKDLQYQRKLAYVRRVTRGTSIRTTCQAGAFPPAREAVVRSATERSRAEAASLCRSRVRPFPAATSPSASLFAAVRTVQFPAGSFTFRADIRFDSSSGLPFGDDGSGSGSPGVLMEGTTADGSSSFSHLVNGAVNGGGPIPSGVWNTYSFGFPVPSAGYVDLRFVPQATWTGTISIDSISVQ